MTRTLTQTSRAALVAAALAVPMLALPDHAMAQATAPAADATTPGAAGEGGSTADMTTTTGSGENTGSAAQSGGSADMSLSYERVVGDLQSGRDFSDQLDGMDADTTVTVTGLTTLDQVAGGSVSTAEDGTPPMTGGQTTNDTTGSAMMQSDTASGSSAGGSVDAPAGMSTGLATGGGTQTATMSEGTAGDIDTALTEGAESLTALRASLADHAPVIEALEAQGYTADDVIALHRDGAELTVIVDDRDS